MEENPKRRLPLPVVQAMVVCREIFLDSRTGQFILVGPTSHVPITQFPAQVGLSLYLHMTGGHGAYALEICLRDADDEPVWACRPAEPFEHREPLLPHQVTFHDLPIEVPRPGRYSLVMVADDREFARQDLWFGAGEAFGTSGRAERR
jgi:hypothetical protein